MNINQTIVKPESTISNTINLIDKSYLKGGIPGIAVVLDDNNIVVGVVTDGDIRKAIIDKIDFSSLLVQS